MVTLRDIRDVVFEELKQRLPGKVIKYQESDQPTIEIHPDPEQIFLIDFNHDEVEVYDGCPLGDTASEEVYTLEPGDPAFLDKLYQALTKLGLELPPNPGPEDSQQTGSA